MTKTILSYESSWPESILATSDNKFWLDTIKKGRHQDIFDHLKPHDLSSYYISGRAMLELGQFSEAEKLLNLGIKSCTNNSLLSDEYYLAKYLNGDISSKELFMLHNELKKSEHPTQTCFEILVGHRQLQPALALLLENWQAVESNPNLKAQYEYWVQRYFPDFFAHYYGYGIMLFQFLTTIAVLIIPWLHAELFLTSWFPILLYMLSLVALGPVAYVNFRMLIERFLGKENCYTEIYPEYVRVWHYGKPLHFDIINHSTSLYKDDNDYSYISLIRYLPFVPNFTYIRGHNLLEHEHECVPLHGVADGARFEELHLPQKSIPFNIIGVRIAQFETAFTKFNNLFKVPGTALIAFSACSATMFWGFREFYQSALFQFILHTKSNFFTYLPTEGKLVFLTQYTFAAIPEYAVVTFSAGLGLLLCNSKSFAQQVLKPILRMPVLSVPFKASIVRTGIMVLCISMLVDRYYGYAAWYVPVFCLSILFYFLFVRTRYKKSDKQIVARVSSAWKNKNESTQLKQFGIRKIDFKRSRYQKLTGRNNAALFWNPTHMVIPQTFLMGAFRYFVFTHNDDTNPISICEINRQTRFYQNNKVVATLPFRMKEVQNSLEENGFKFIERESQRNFLTDTLPMIMIVLCIGCLLVFPFSQLTFMPKFVPILAGILLNIPFILYFFYRPWLLPVFGYFCWLGFEAGNHELRSYKNSRASFYTVGNLLHNTGYQPNEFAVSLSNVTKLDNISLTIKNPTYGEYERHINSRLDTRFQNVPPFIAYQRQRDSIIDLLTWELFQKSAKFESKKHANAHEEYCNSLGLKPALNRNNNELQCGFSVSYPPKKSEQYRLKDVYNSPFSEKTLKKLDKEYLGLFIRKYPSDYAHIPMSVRRANFYVNNWMMFYWMAAVSKKPSLYNMVPEDIKKREQFNTSLIKISQLDQSTIDALKSVIPESSYAKDQDAMDIMSGNTKNQPMYKRLLTGLINKRKQKIKYKKLIGKELKNEEKTIKQLNQLMAENDTHQNTINQNNLSPEIVALLNKSKVFNSGSKKSQETPSLNDIALQFKNPKLAIADIETGMWHITDIQMAALENELLKSLKQSPRSLAGGTSNLKRLSVQPAKMNAFRVFLKFYGKDDVEKFLQSNKHILVSALKDNPLIFDEMETFINDEPGLAKLINKLKNLSNDNAETQCLNPDKGSFVKTILPSKGSLIKTKSFGK
jgi:hypothetical protein